MHVHTTMVGGDAFSIEVISNVQRINYGLQRKVVKDCVVGLVYATSYIR